MPHFPKQTPGLKLHKIVSLPIITVLLIGCSGQPQPTSNPDVQITETGNGTETFSETVHINNCGGKADAEQVAERSFATNIEGTLGVDYYAVLEGKYSQYRGVTKSHKMIAPAVTNMEFLLKWTELTLTGSILASGISGKYSVRVPVSVEQISSRDLGCGSESLANNPPNPITTIEQNEGATITVMPVVVNPPATKVTLLSGAEYIEQTFDKSDASLWLYQGGLQEFRSFIIEMQHVRRGKGYTDDARLSDLQIPSVFLEGRAGDIPYINHQGSKHSGFFITSEDALASVDGYETAYAIEVLGIRPVDYEAGWFIVYMRDAASAVFVGQFVLPYFNFQDYSASSLQLNQNIAMVVYRYLNQRGP